MLRIRKLVVPDWTQGDRGVSREEKKGADVRDRSTSASDVYGTSTLSAWISVKYKCPSPTAMQE